MNQHLFGASTRIYGIPLSAANAALGVWLLSLARREWRGDHSGRNPWRVAWRTALGLLLLLLAATEAARAMQLDETAWGRIIRLVGWPGEALLAAFLVSLVGSIVTSRRRQRTETPAIPGTTVTPTPARSMHEDPGWRPTLRRNAPPIALLRTIYLFFIAVPFLWLSILSDLEPEGDPRPWFVWVVVAFSAYGLGALVWFRRRPLRTDPSGLVVSYRTRFFFGLASAESPVLFGFLGFFLVQEVWIYLLGMGFGLLGLAIAAPTRRDVEHLQARITASGSPLSLWNLLTTPPG